jgi:drug/metabolite transporter (DMT)-like permease
MGRYDRTLVWVAYAIISTVWGTTWLAIRIGLESVPPFLSAGLRCWIAAAVLYGIVHVRHTPVPFSSNAWRVYISLGVLTIAFPFALIYWGQQYIATGLSSILFAAFPLMVAVLSHLMLKDEPLTAFKIGAVILGFAGVVVIFAAETSVTGKQEFLGMSAVLVSVFLQALALILIKKFGEPVSAIAMNLVGMAMGGTMLLLLSAAVEGGSTVRWDANAIGSLLYLSLVASVVTFVAYYWLLKRMDAVYLSLSSFINPIVAIVLGSLFLGERLPPGVFTGAILVLAGLLLANAKALYARHVR